MARFDLNDKEWTVIEPLLPKRDRGPTRRDDWVILNGIFYIPGAVLNTTRVLSLIV